MIPTGIPTPSPIFIILSFLERFVDEGTAVVCGVVAVVGREAVESAEAVSIVADVVLDVVLLAAKDDLLEVEDCAPLAGIFVKGNKSPASEKVPFKVWQSHSSMFALSQQN